MKYMVFIFIWPMRLFNFIVSFIIHFMVSALTQEEQLWLGKALLIWGIPRIPLHQNPTPPIKKEKSDEPKKG